MNTLRETGPLATQLSLDIQLPLRPVEQKEKSVSPELAAAIQTLGRSLMNDLEPDKDETESAPDYEA